MIGFIVWVVIGGIIGWLASIVMRTDGQQGLFLNVIVGIVGAFLAGLVVGGGQINAENYSVTSLIASFVGAVVLLAIVNVVRRGAVR